MGLIGYIIAIIIACVIVAPLALFVYGKVWGAGVYLGIQQAKERLLTKRKEKT